MAARGFITLLALLTIASLPMRGQDNESRMVNLNLIAVDGKGQPVDDMTEDDLKITDAGKPQRIAFFRHSNSKSWFPTDVGPNEISNRKIGDIPYATVILFDLLNENFGNRGYAENELKRYLERLDNADYLYLYLLTVDGKLLAVHGMPDRAREGEAPDTAPWTRQIRPILEDVIKKVTRLRPLDIDIAARVPTTYNALNALGLQLARIPGRKNIVWITNGVPISLGPRRSDTGDFVDFTEPLRRLSESLERSRTAIYPVRQSIGGSGVPGADGQPAPVGDGLGSEMTLDEFAHMTGGRPNEGRDIGAAIKQAMADVRTSYQIGYYPPSANWDDKLHKLRVTSTRKGVRLETKTEYYAWKESAGARLRESVDAVMSAPFDAGEIGLRAGLLQDPKDSDVTRFVLRIDSNDIVLARDAGQYTGHLRVVPVGHFADDRKEEFPMIPLDVHYNVQQYDQALKDGIVVGESLSLKDMNALRLIVYDQSSNAVGSVTVSIK